MSMIIQEQLPSAESVAAQYPVTAEHKIDERREAVNRILRGEDKRTLAIVGPCSAWPSPAVEEYAARLARLQEELSDQLLLVLRAYIQKPRTTIGWPGPLYYPNPLSEKAEIAQGIVECRRLMQSVGTILPLADEMLFTHNADYFAPLLSYVAVGARSAEDMEHRYVASGLDMAVGMKNPTSGDIEIGTNSVVSAQHPHIFAYQGHMVETTGNPHAHLILRGGSDGSNYDPHSIANAGKYFKKNNVKHPAIIVDASHDNSKNGSGKDPTLQSFAISNILHGISEQREEFAAVKGFMLESFLRDGNQKISPTMSLDGLSITDPCLGWEKTERLLRKTADTLSSAR